MKKLNTFCKKYTVYHPCLQQAQISRRPRPRPRSCASRHTDLSSQEAWLVVRLRCHHGHQDQLEGMSWPRDSPAKSRQRQCWLPQQQQQPPTTTYSRPLAQGVSTTRRPHSPLALSRRRRPRKSCGEFHPHTFAQPTQRSHRDHLSSLKSPSCHPSGVNSPPPAPYHQAAPPREACSIGCSSGGAAWRGGVRG